MSRSTVLESAGQSSPTSPPDLMRAEEVAELFNNVPVSTIHAWARRSYLPSVKIGKHRRFRRDEVIRFIEALG